MAKNIQLYLKLMTIKYFYKVNWRDDNKKYVTYIQFVSRNGKTYLMLLL